MGETSREWRLTARPRGMPADSDFELAEVPVRDPEDGEVVIRNSWISVDPTGLSRWRLRA